MNNESKASSARRTAGSLKRGVMPPSSDDCISPELVRNIRRCELLEQYGPPEKQKEELVDNIIETFANPGEWPMTDADRIAVLQRWYKMARTIRQTEAA